MAIFDWPATLVPRNIQIQPPRRTQSMTTSLTDYAQVMPAIRPPFTLTMEFDAIEGEDVLAWRAMEALLEGRANVARLPLFDLWYRASEAAIAAGVVPHSDGTFFSDGAGYSTADLDGVLVSGVQGQRHITVDFGSYGQLLQGGLYFGLGEHPYMASGVSWDGSVATIRCSPTLRKDCEAVPLKLKPTMLGRLTSDDGMAIKLQNLRHGTPTVTFQEDFQEGLYP